MCPPPRKPPQSRHKEAMPGSGVAGAGGLRCADSSRTDGGSDAASWKRLLGGRRDARLCARWDTYVFYYDLEAYGNPERKPNIRMKAVASHLALAEALAFQNHAPCFSSKWSPLRGFGSDDVPAHFGRMVLEAAMSQGGRSQEIIIVPSRPRPTPSKPRTTRTSTSTGQRRYPLR